MGKINNVIEETEYATIMKRIKNPPRGTTTFSSEGIVSTSFQTDFLSERGTRVFPLEPARVADLLDERRVEEMLNSYPRTPVFLENRPGKGKNYFILNILLPAIIARGGRMLILTPRVLLKSQTKVDVMKAQEMDLELYTDKRIKEEHSFGAVDVYSYQEISNLLSMDGYHMPTDYEAVVFDEAHFFSQDSDFNSTTELVFNYLMSTFIRKRILRIYMTGTPDRIYGWIEEKEKKHQSKQGPEYQGNFYYMLHPVQDNLPLMNFYHFESNYDYLNPIFFNDDKSHSNLIKMITSSPGSKWLIFVESSEMGKDIVNKLPDGLKKEFINSERIHTDTEPEFRAHIDKLVNESEMPVDVLAITKCLDVGVNIKTRNVNIVCFLRDQIDFLQAIGRKRINEDAKEKEVVNLYIPDRNTKDIMKCKSIIENTYNDYKERIVNSPLLDKPYSGGSLELPFCLDHGKLTYNSFTLDKLYWQMKDYEKLPDEIDSSNESANAVIRKYFLSWIPGAKGAYADEDNTEENDKEYSAKRQEFTEIINKYVPAPFDKNQFYSLIGELQKAGLEDTRKDKRRDRPWNPPALSKRLREYGISYKIEKHGEKYSCTATTTAKEDVE